MGTIPEKSIITVEWNHRSHYLATDPTQIRVDALLSDSGECLAALVIDGTPPDTPKMPRQTISIVSETYEQLAEKAGPPVKAVVRVTKIDLPSSSEIPTIWVDEYTYLDRDGNPFLSTLDVIFSKPAHAKRFVPPSWFGKEITDDQRYSPKGIYDALQKGDLTYYRAGEVR